MNLGINPIANTPAQYKNNPKFGMAMSIDKSAVPVIKNHFMGLEAYKTTNFIKTLGDIAKRQEKNPVNIIVKATEENRGKLIAEVVDSKAGEEFGAISKRQYLQVQEGNTLFLNHAEEYANRVNEVNRNVRNVVDMLTQKEKAANNPAKLNNRTGLNLNA